MRAAEIERVESERAVLIDWRGMILFAEVVGSESGDVTVVSRGFAPPRGARVTMRRIGALQSGSVAPDERWLVDFVQRRPAGRNYELILIRGRQLTPTGVRVRSLQQRTA